MAGNETAKEEPEYVTDSVLSKSDVCTELKARRRCVLKEFDISQKNEMVTDSLREKWLREVDALIKIRGHDGLAMYRDVFSRGNTVWVEMEYCDGGNLSSFCFEKKPDNEVKHRFMIEMASALAYLHNSNVHHQNIQPDNVMVIYKSNGQPTVKLANFGLSKLIASTKFYGDLIGYYMLGEVAGKYYLAPEIFSGHCGISADVYSLALLFVAMILETTYEEKLAAFVTTKNGGVLGIGEFAHKNKCDFQICPSSMGGVYFVLNLMLRFNYRTRPGALEVENRLRKAPSELYPPSGVSRPFLSPMIMKPKKGHHKYCNS